MAIYRYTSHSVFLCDYHLVWPTKYRRAVLNEGVLAYLRETIKGLADFHPDLIVKEIKKFPHMKKVYWGTQSIWSAGYFVSTVGVNEAIIRKYIQNQGQEDSGQ